MIVKTMGKLSVVLTLVLIAFGHAETAWGKEIFRIDQQVAFGSFSSTDSSECVFTQVSVFASEAIVQFPPGPGDSSSSGFVEISQFDNCSGIQVLGATGLASLADENFQASPTLDSATLNATINVFDFISGNSFDVSVNLIWTSTGPIGRRNSHSHESLPGCKNNAHGNSIFRPAQASGSIVSDGDGETNFTPGVSVNADLSSDKAGNVDIGCE